MKDIVTELLEEHGELQSLRGVNETKYTDIGDLCYPTSVEFGTRQVDFQPVMEEEQIGSPIGQILSEDLTSTICYSTSPTDSQWIEPYFADEAFDNNPQIKPWKQYIGALLHEQLAADYCRFYAARYEAVRMATTFGTAFTISGIDNENKGLWYMTIPMNNLYIQDDDRGRIDVVHYTMDLTRNQLIKKYGEANIPEDILSRASNQSRYRVIVVIKKRMGGKAGARKQNKPVAEYHILEEKKHMLQEGGYDMFPGAGIRWAKVAGTPYGFSPAMACFKSLKQIEILRNLTIRAGELAVMPPLTGPEMLIGKVGLYPGYMTPSIGDQRVEPIKLGTLPQQGFPQLEYLRTECEQAFFTDAVNLRIKKERQSVREIGALEREQLAKMESVFSTIETEYYSKLLARHYNMLNAKGWILPPPIDTSQQQLKIRFKNRVQEAQDMSKSQAVSEFFQFDLLPFIQAFPGLLDEFNPKRTMQLMADTKNVPLEIFNTPEEKQAIEQAKQEEMQQQQLLQQAQAGELMTRGVKNLQA